MMMQFKEKSSRLLNKIVNRFHNKQYIKHLLLIILITLVGGLVVSIFITRSITVNDTVIRYTEPPSEELDTEGYSGEEIPEESLAEEEVSVMETIPE